MFINSRGLYFIAFSIIGKLDSCHIDVDRCGAISIELFHYFKKTNVGFCHYLVRINYSYISRPA